MRKGGKTLGLIGAIAAEQKANNFEKKYLVFIGDKSRKKLFFSLLCAMLYKVDLENGKYIYEQLQIDATDFNKQYKVVTNDKRRI